MKKLHVTAAKNKSMVFSVGFGILASLIISIVLAICLTSLIQNEKLNENGIIGVFLVRMIATLIGGLLGTGLSNGKFLPVISTISACYLIVLLGAGIILFDNSFEKLWLGVLSVSVGAAIALLIRLKPQTTRKKAVRFTK